MPEIYDNEVLMGKEIKKIQAGLIEQQLQLIIDDVIDIYNGKYRTYESYYKEKHRLNEIIHQKNNEAINFNPDSCTYSQYIYTPIFNEKTFNYIKTKEDK